MHALMIRLWLLLPLALAACTVGRPGVDVPASVPNIQVARGEVRISLPAPGSREWAWNRPTADPAATEYLWTVWLYPEDAAPLGVAVYVRRNASAPLTRGPLARLLEQAVVDRWDAIDRNGAAAQRLRDVRLEAVGQRVILVVRDTAFVHDVFATRPATALVAFYDYTGDGREALDEWPGLQYPKRVQLWVTQCEFH